MSLFRACQALPMVMSPKNWWMPLGSWFVFCRAAMALLGVVAGRARARDRWVARRRRIRRRRREVGNDGVGAENVCDRSDRL